MFFNRGGRAGLGQAEASSVTWGDVDLVKSCMSVRRHKTNVRFTVPLYPLMERPKKAGGDPPAGTRVLRIPDAKRALIAACERLGLESTSCALEGRAGQETHRQMGGPFSAALGLLLPDKGERCGLNAPRTDSIRVSSRT
jgi:hypothetical protein